MATIIRLPRAVVGTLLLLAPLACSDGPPTQPVKAQEAAVLRERSQTPQFRGKIRARMRIKIREGATSEIVLERENGRILTMSRKDRSGRWHKVLGDGAADASAALVQYRDTAVFGPVGTFVEAGVLGAYGMNEFYDSTGAFWRVKSLWGADSPPKEEVHYRNAVLVVANQNTWTAENGGWLLTATRTEVYEPETGEFLAEMLDSLQHWQPSAASQEPKSVPSLLFASARDQLDCEPLLMAFYFVQSTECPNCATQATATAVSAFYLGKDTYKAVSFVRNPANVWNIKDAVAISTEWVASFNTFLWSAASTTRCFKDRSRCLNGSGGSGTGSGDGTIKKT